MNELKQCNWKIAATYVDVWRIEHAAAGIDEREFAVVVVRAVFFERGFHRHRWHEERVAAAYAHAWCPRIFTSGETIFNQ